MRNGWQTKPLGELLEVQNGYAFNSKAFSSSEGVPLVRIRSLKAGVETTTRFIGEYDEKYLVETGDLLIGMDGEFGCYEWKGGPALLNQRVCKLQGFGSLLDPRFLFYGVNSHLKAIEDVTGFATVKHLSSKQILAIEFPFPSMPEQKRIVGILDEAFASIAIVKANAEKNLQNSSALFESHLDSAFTQEGDGWSERRLSEVADSISTGPFGTMLHKSDYVSEGIPVVNPMNIVDSRIVPSSKMMVGEETRDRLNTYVLRIGDVVVGRRGELGRCALVTEREVGWLCGTGSFVVRLSKAMDGEFFVALFGSAKVKARLEANSVGATMSSLNHGILNDLRLPVPPIADQRSIMSKVLGVGAEIQHLESIYQRKLAALDALKQSLLHQAFSGQL